MLLLEIINPSIINMSPIILCQLTGSPNNMTEKIKTNTKPNVVKGYA